MIRLARTALLAASVALPAAAAAAEPPVPTISIIGEGTVTAAPDTAIVTVGVVTQSKTAGPALTENNARMGKLIAEVEAAGIAGPDIGTSGFTIEPIVVYPPPAEDGTQDPPRVTGYRVDNRITVKIRDIAKAGDLLDRVVRIGANQVQGIQFTVEDDAALLDEARLRAVKDAQAKAAVYADAAGLALGRVLLISEATQPPIPLDIARMPAKMAAESVPIAPGEQEIGVTVRMDWEIRQPN